MPGPVIPNRPNPFTQNLPSSLKGLVETLFPPDSLGIEPGAGVMPVGPILGAMGRKVAPGILGGLEGAVPRVIDDVPVPQSMPSMPEVDDLLSGFRKNLGSIPSKGAAGHGIPDYVPVGGEAAFNATRTPNLGPTSINQSPVMEALGRWKNEMGEEGLRKLRRAPIPGRRIQAPPREPK